MEESPHLVAVETAQAARQVGDVSPRDPLGQAREQPAADAFAQWLRSPCSAADDEIMIAELMPNMRDVLGSVLAVGVHNDDEVALRRLDAALRRRAAAELIRVAVVLVSDLACNLARPVRRAVVDDHDLVAVALQPLEAGADRLQAGLLVVRRYHHRRFETVRTAVCRHRLAPRKRWI